MQNYFQKEALTKAKKTIHSFYVWKNIEKGLEFFSREHLTVIGVGENRIFNSFEEVRKCYYKYADIMTSTYKIISEDYRVEVSSHDSCIVIAKIGFQSDVAHLNYKLFVLFSFYFQQVDDKILITFLHIHLPEKISEEEKANVDQKFNEELLNQFENTKHTAAKSFLYKADLPYCYVNDLFRNLLDCKKINLKNYSSLAHIHPNDQQKYFDFMQKIFAEKNAGVSEGWRWHNSYRVIYRLVNRKHEEIKVLEWGNFLSLNGNFIVNAFVTPLDDLEVINASPPPTLSNFLDSSQDETSALLNDCGIHIGNILLIYPRRHKLFINGQSVLLTPIEFDLLLVLAAHLNKILTTKEIYKKLWDKEDLNDTSFTLKTHISNLRKKLREASDDKIHLNNCKGDGYCLFIPDI